MKKILAIVLAVAMIASVAMLAGCGQSKQNDTAATADSAKETLTMATNAYFPPYEYYEGDKIIGIDAEVAQAIADKLGMELKIVDIEFDSIITGVQTGKYDMGMAGMTVTEERKQSVDFSDSYATGIQSVIVPENSPITSVDDILAEGATYKVGVQLSTTGDIYISDDLGAYSSPPPATSISPMTSATLLLSASPSSRPVTTLLPLCPPVRSTLLSSTTSPQRAMLPLLPV